MTEWLECGECGDLFQSAHLRRAPNPWQEGGDLLGCPCCGSIWGEPMHQICEYKDCEKRAENGSPHPTLRYTWRCWAHRPEATGELK